MARDNIDDWQEVPVDEVDDWQEVSVEPIAAAPEISKAESFTRGAAQGLSFGFADEITAGAKTIYDDVKSVFTGDSSRSVPIQRDEMGRVLNPEAGSQFYEEELKRAREADRQAQEANPATYGAGVIGGGVATSFIPGLGALNVAKGAGAVNAIGKAALSGGIAGAGFSEADNIKDLGADTAMGAGTGAVVGGAFQAAPKVLGAAKKGAKWTGKQIFKLATDLSDEQIDVILKDPKGIRNALDGEGLAEEAEKGIVKLQEFIKQADNDAWSTLSAKPSVPKSTIKNFIMDAQDSIKVAGPAQNNAMRTLDTFKGALDDFGSEMSERDLKQFVQALDDNINWEAQDAKVANDLLKQIRNSIDEGVLKKNNRLYKEAMKPVSDLTKNRDAVASALGLKKVAGEGYKATDTTLSKFNTLPQERRVFSQKAIEQFDDAIGGDLMKKARASQVERATQSGVTQGSRNTVMGLIGGGALGGLTGGPLGAAAGFAKDRYGRKVGKEFLLRGMDVFTPDRMQRLGKFAKPLQDAAGRGNNSLGATHFLLFKNNPEYRQKIQEIEGDDE